MTVPPLFMPDEDDEEAQFDDPGSLNGAFDDVVTQVAREVLGVSGAEDGGTSASFAGVSSVPAPTPMAYDEDEEPLTPDEQAALRRSAIAALYGSECPLAKDTEPKREDWGKWVEALWDLHKEGKRKRLHLVQRNRYFRAGSQWVSSKQNAPWREPPKSPNASRFVMNMVAPALDQRQQVVSEQRPGFRTRPQTQDVDDLKRAEVQQVALEYQYDQQNMPAILRETYYWAGTDGVAFWHLYWEPEAGPWHETEIGERMRLGDARTEILRIEQVCVSANASANQRPWYWIVKKTIPLADAVAKYGDVAMKADTARTRGTNEDLTSTDGLMRHGLELPGVDELMQGQETVDHFTLYCEPSEYLPEGMQIVSIGCYPVYVGPLMYGVVPMVRVSDGSSDPAFFPQALMEHWVEDQVLCNGIISKWIDNVRRNAGGSLLARPKALSAETMIGGNLSIWEVKGQGSLTEQVYPLPGFSVGSDAKELLALAKKNFEDKSGWNDASRGSYSDAASGRAILAQRESLERIFAEPVNAVARAMVDWGKILIHILRFGYDIPRTIGIVGASRSDLAQQLSSDDFDGVADVEIDPETLMPMPRALRLFLLDQMFERGVLTPQEYRRRLPYAYTRNLDTPDEDHQARAKRVADAIRSGKPVPPVIWQDNEAIHQDVLEREILLQPDIDPQVFAQADARWKALAQQAAMKMGAAPAQPTQAPPQGDSLPPTEQPMLATNPGIAAAPVADLTGYTGEMQQKALMDRTQPY